MIKLNRIESGLFSIVVLGALLACKNPLGGGDEKADDAEAGASGDKIGVAACDEYIEKYEQCLTSSTKIPDVAKTSMRDAFDQQRKAWKAAAATPAGKAAMEAGCKQAMEAAKQAMAAYDCKW